MKEILKKLIVEYWDREPEYVQRNKAPEDLIAGKHSLVIVGPRRAGKSYTLHEARDHLISKGIEKNSFIYLNFEDERLAEFTKKDFDQILEAYHSLAEGKPIFFLDEIQNVDGWAKFIRRLADSGYKVLATGSNSNMLSKEIAERLGGRFPEIDIYPLNFMEFLKFKGFEFKKEHLYSKDRFAIVKYFDEYITFGGFPEVALLSDEASKMKVLRSYFNLVFYRDLMTDKDLKNEEALRFMIKKLRECIGNVITPRAIYASLKKADIQVGPNTVEKYIDYLEEAFLVIPCYPFAKSVVKQEKKKRYFIDNGYIKLFEVKEDKNLLLENLVFTELIKRGKRVHFHQGKKECDFIVDKSLAIQVTQEVTEKNEDREYGGLMEAMEVYEIQEGIILTYDQEKEVVINNKKIQLMPVWKWLLYQMPD
jgi:hypothetical protein